MKLLKNIILQDYKPQLKCGEELIGSLVGSGVGLFGDILANEQSADNVAAQLQAQQLENQKNRDWQTEEAEKSRQFTTSERLQQQNYQTSERQSAAQENLRQSERMAEVNAMYNSPVYQSKELNKARINPQVYFGQSSSFGGSSQSALGSHAGAAPSGVAPHGVGSVGGLSPVAFQPLHLRVPELQQGIASLVKAGTEAKVAPAQIRQLLASAIDQEEDAKYKAMLTEYQDLANQLFIQDFPARLQKAFVEVELLRQQKLTMEKQGKNFDAQSDLAKAEENLKKKMEQLTGEELFKATFLNSQLEDWYERSQREVESRIASNKASAHESEAHARELDFFNDLNRSEREYLVKNIHNQAAEMYQRAQLSEKNNELLKYAISQAKYTNDQKEIKFWNDLIREDLKTVSDIASDWTKVGAFRQLSNAQQNKILQKERDFYSVHVVDSYDKNGKFKGRTQSYNQ